MHSGDDVALFIDWENFKISLAAGQRAPNVSALKEEASNHGRVVVAKAYADWVTRTPELRGASQFINDPPALYAAGIEPIYVPTRLARPGGLASGRTTRVKNSVDVKMTADCIECAHSYPNIGTYVLVSGDSDFIHVINALRTMGKRAIVIGVSWATSRRFADQVDELILYDVDVDSVAAPEPVTEPVPVADDHGSARVPSSNRQDLAEIIAAIEDIVRTERQAGGTPLLTSIKQRVLRRYPSFDEKKLGFPGFKKLMSRVAQNGNIQLITAGLVDWAIMADEKPPVEANGVPANGAQDTTVEPDEPPLKTKRSRFPFSRSTRTAVTADNEEAAATDAADEERADAEPTTVDDAASQPAELAPVGGDGDHPGMVNGASAGLSAILAETLPQLDLPAGPDDGLDGSRVADLIVMADTLEHQQEVSHVAFNFLVSEVCQALDQGLKAEHLEISQHWSQVYSRLYITRMVRGLGNGDLFVKGWHNATDKESGRTRRLRTFYLNRNNPLVEKVLQDHWNPQGDTEPVPASIEAPDFEPSDLEQPPAEVEPQSPAEASFLSKLFRPRR